MKHDYHIYVEVVDLPHGHGSHCQSTQFVGFGRPGANGKRQLPIHAHIGVGLYVVSPQVAGLKIDDFAANSCRKRKKKKKRFYQSLPEVG